MGNAGLHKGSDYSLKYKMSYLLLVTVGLTLLVNTVFALSHRFHDINESLINNLEIQSKIVSMNSVAAIVFEDKEAVLETLSSLRASKDIVRASIYKDGVIFGDFIIDVGDRYQSGDSGYFQLISSTITIRHPIESSGAVIGELVITASMANTYEYILFEAALIVIVSLLAGGVAILLSRKLRNGIIDPVNTLSNDIEMIIDTQNYGLRCDIESYTELNRLSSGFNQLLSQIEDKQRDLSNELEIRLLAEQKLEEIAHYDSVTGLPNRHCFNVDVNERMNNHDASFTLFMIDMDNFKQVNDTLGHPIGDALLKFASERMGNVLRRDDCLYRLGGDEFALILDGVSSKQVVSSVANKLVEVLTPAFKIQGHQIFIGASLGSCVYPVDAMTKDDLMKNADLAMYYAKHQGKSQHVFFNPEMNTINIRRHNLESALREALQNDEIEFHFQPQFDQVANQIVGAEALVRWNSADLGYISPLEFIPIAEESGLISSIGKLALTRSCQQLRDWHDQGFSDMRIAVNVSERQLHDDDFIDFVISCLEKYNIRPEFLELELTESVLMEDDPDIVRRVNALEEAGVTLAIDDFGTGYSSLSYIKRFPIGKLKIDQSFVYGIPHDKENCAIVKAIISFSTSLGLIVIAEGVETEEQAKFISNEGCGLIQGYFFGKPMSSENFSQLLQKTNNKTQIHYLREVKITNSK